MFLLYCIPLAFIKFVNNFFVVTRLDFGTAMIVPAFCSLHRINGVLEL
jgi:hypothetical protein